MSRAAGFADEVDALRERNKAKDRDGALAAISGRMMQSIDFTGSPSQVTDFVCTHRCARSFAPWDETQRPWREYRWASARSRRASTIARNATCDLAPRARSAPLAPWTALNARHAEASWREDSRASARHARHVTGCSVPPDAGFGAVPYLPDFTDGGPDGCLSGHSRTGILGPRHRTAARSAHAPLCSPSQRGLARQARSTDDDQQPECDRTLPTTRSSGCRTTRRQCDSMADTLLRSSVALP